MGVSILIALVPAAMSLYAVRRRAMFATNCIAATGLWVFFSAWNKTVISSRSPDGWAVIEIHEACGPPDCMIDATFKRDLGILGYVDPTGVYRTLAWLRRDTILTRSDWLINFAHVAWSPDSHFAGIYVDNAYGDPIQVGYDTQARRLVPVETTADIVRRSIIVEYGLTSVDLAPYGGDPLEWANPTNSRDDPARQAFRMRHRSLRQFF
jgi:hypothetical protein